MSVELFQPVPFILAEKNQQDANIHLHANDILQSCDNQDLEHSCTWKGKRNGVCICVPWVTERRAHSEKTLQARVEESFHLLPNRKEFAYQL